MELPGFVGVVEVGPRDGLQNERSSVPTGEKVALIGALAAAGLRRFEETSFVSPRAIPQFANAEDVLAGLRETGRSTAAWSRTSGATSGRRRRGGRYRGRGDRGLLPKESEYVGGRGPRRLSPHRRPRSEGRHPRAANLSIVFGDPFEGRPGLGQVLRVVSGVVEASIDDVALSDT